MNTIYIGMGSGTNVPPQRWAVHPRHSILLRASGVKRRCPGISQSLAEATVEKVGTLVIYGEEERL